MKSTLSAPNRAIVAIALLVILTVVPAVAFSQAQTHRPDSYEFWPGTTYDSSIPTPAQVLGHPIGERVTSHGEIARYFEALVNAAPDQIQTAKMGATWEGRDIFYAAVGSAKNIARLPEIQAGYQALADPRATDQATADRLIADLPAVIWLGYGVHGNEISSPDAAMLTAYHLLAARGSSMITGILDNVIVLIDPLQNPDGRDRFVNHYRSTEGLIADSDRISAEHDEPWPGGRTNHYLFDLNRDWFALTQPETRGRVEALLEWYPLVFVDLHEMGGDSSYYFAPEAVPYNPHLAKHQRTNLEFFGKNNAKWFDEFGFDYFTREIFDAFYPGYGASWPAYYGAIAMTYEQASARGLSYLRGDGNVLHFRETVRHHFVASVATAETSARDRQRLLTDFYEYRKSAIAEGKSDGPRQIALSSAGDPTLTDRLAGLLAVQGVDLVRTTAAAQGCGSGSLPAGSYLIDMAQPAKRFLRNMLDDQVSMDDEFLAEQESRRARNLRDQIYDVTAWSLPLQFGVEARPCSKLIDAQAVAVEASDFDQNFVYAAASDLPRAKVAYLVPWGSRGAIRLLSGALQQGLDILSPDRSFFQRAPGSNEGDGREFPAGTLVLKTRDNPEDLHERMVALAQSSGAEVLAVDSSWVESGINWGSNQTVKLRAPRIAIAWDSPTNGLSAGATRYILERQFGYPVSIIRTQTLARSDLSRYNVLILPDSRGGYGRVLGDRGQENIQNWVRAGGTLVTFAGATNDLGEKGLDLLAVSTQKPDDIERPGSVIETEAEYLASVVPEDDRLDSVAGVLLRAEPDFEHWMSAGLASTLNILYSGSNVYEPLDLTQGNNVVRFAAADELLASGYLWAENRTLLAFKPAVMQSRAGRGQVVAFVADPTIRAYLDGLNVLMANAIFRAPAHASPVRW